MSTYTFSLANYHAVKEASIKLDGITVLSGVNGSGKSTIARWLHHTVKVLNDYDSMVDKDGIRKLMHLMDRMRRFVASVDNYSDKSRMVRAAMDYEDEIETLSFDAVRGIFLHIVNIVSDAMNDNITDGISEANLKRYCDYFNINRAECVNTEVFKGKVLEYLNDTCSRIEEECREKKAARSSREFCKKIYSFPDSELEGPEISLKFMEDDTNMLDSETFRMPLNLRNVVYINTQFIGQSLSLSKSSELSDMLSNSRGEISTQAAALVKFLQKIIGGDVTITQKEKEPFMRLSAQIRYTLVRKDGTSFDLRGAATGEISFSYILQLIKNGWIDDGTLLIIDEPESHLHPQWIVEYAKTLILLHQKLGTKILISSHNPDMVSAIQTIADVFGVLDETNFYLAEPAKEDNDQYVFTHQGSDIEKIFDSFNIAIDRINAFGARNDVEDYSSDCM
jgi:predicted ATPase